MNDLAEIKDYQSFKATLKQELTNLANGFVRVGYLLKVARDTDILHESGYKSLTEFAAAEYGLTKDTVSRFIAINDRFAENGYSERIQTQFEGYGVAKLQEMLNLPEGVIGALEPSMTRAQIREVKEEYRKEQDVTDVERMLEPQGEEPLVLNTDMERFAFYYGKENPEEYVRIHLAADDRGLADVLAPSGTGVLYARVPGQGKKMLTVTEAGKPVKLCSMRTGELEETAWKQMREAFSKACVSGMTPEASWEQVYGEDFPRKTAVPEPVSAKQPEERLPEPKKQESRKQEAEKKEKVVPAQPEEKTTSAVETTKPEAIEADVAAVPEQEDAPAEAVLCEEPYLTEKKAALREKFNYLGTLIREERWKQIHYTLKDMEDITGGIMKHLSAGDIPGQQSIEDFCGNEEEDDEKE